MSYTILGIVGIILGGILLSAFVVAYWKNGTSKAARETIEVLKDQVSALKDRVVELEKLQPLVEILRGLVTQAAPVKELAEKQEQRHEENVVFLSRIEGSLSRLESHVILGDRNGNKG